MFLSYFHYCMAIKNKAMLATLPNDIATMLNTIIHITQIQEDETMGIRWECADRDGQNHHMLMILKSKSNHINKGDLKSKSFWKWWFENQNHIENQMVLKSF